MTRLRRIEKAGRYFFVTTNLARGVTPLSEAERDLILEQLAFQRDRGEFYLFAYAVMPDHLHMLLYPRESSLPMILRNLKSKTGYRIVQIRRSRGPLWQDGYFDFICRRVKDFWAKFEYIHANPVEAGLVSRPEQWKWSSCAHYRTERAAPVVPDEVRLPAEGRTFLWPAPWT